ncbi:MAG: flippase-like domain-containing protein [Lentisphaeria bacterium]|nr:flippase-like domain-containing protein [Candidatus Neomarinimicrobiota bacterium]MCF7842464.1 flippase-like domain-containing protein [Lentisphaeria bacterium]
MIQGISWIAALLLAGLIFSQLPLHSILQTVGALSIGQWILWAGLNLGIIAFLTLRWQILTTLLGGSIRFRQLLAIRQAGQAISFVTPGPQIGGEPLQVFWLWKTCGMPGDSAVLSVALDRFFEFWFNFSILLLAVLILILSPLADLAGWTQIGVILLGILLTIGGLVWVLFQRARWISRWLQQMAFRWQNLPRLKHLDTHWQSMAQRFKERVPFQKPVLLLAASVTLAGWAGLLTELWLLLRFLHLSVDIFQFIFIFVAMRLAFLLPLPGGIGTLETALFWAFQALNFPAAAAIGLIALMRLRDAVILAGGLVAMRSVKPS